MDCDGLGDDTGAFPSNCFPGGDTQLPTMAFSVVPGHF
jgi:hypothetical protein